MTLVRAGGNVKRTHAHLHRPRERWALTGNSFAAFLLTKASEWEQSKKECNVYGVCVIWGLVRAAYAQVITTGVRLLVSE